MQIYIYIYIYTKQMKREPRGNFFFFFWEKRGIIFKLGYTQPCFIGSYRKLVVIELLRYPFINFHGPKVKAKHLVLLTLLNLFTYVLNIKFMKIFIFEWSES